ncbi:hypothetical protein [Dyadobacter sp. OTU695]|uniref:hypothetical protein n=1 Tax=Dyadobacter sp. OTU695 TaxID=3043860 RepID=UPI00313C6DAE
MSDTWRLTIQGAHDTISIDTRCDVIHSMTKDDTNGYLILGSIASRNSQRSSIELSQIKIQGDSVVANVLVSTDTLKVDRLSCDNAGLFHLRAKDGRLILWSYRGKCNIDSVISLSKFDKNSITNGRYTAVGLSKNGYSLVMNFDKKTGYLSVTKSLKDTILTGSVSRHVFTAQIPDGSERLMKLDTSTMSFKELIPNLLNLKFEKFINGWTTSKQSSSTGLINDKGIQITAQYSRKLKKTVKLLSVKRFPNSGWAFFKTEAGYAGFNYERSFLKIKGRPFSILVNLDNFITSSKDNIRHIYLDDSREIFFNTSNKKYLIYNREDKKHISCKVFNFKQSTDEDIVEILAAREVPIFPVRLKSGLWRYLNIDMDGNARMDSETYKFAYPFHLNYALVKVGGESNLIKR